MNNMDLLAQTFADAFSTAAPFAFTAGIIAMMFSAVSRFFVYCSRSRVREMHDCQKEIEKVQKSVDDLEKKYPPISPCDYHKDCLDCHLYNTAFSGNL